MSQIVVDSLYVAFLRRGFDEDQTFSVHFLSRLTLPMIVPGSAAAGNARQPIFGDLNRDGRVDRVTLGPDTGSPTGTPTCEVSVEYGKRDGGFRAPQTYSYTSPWPNQPFCPNMGEAINLGKRGQIELVLTHFVANDDPELLVLRDFKLVATFNGMTFPSTIRSADFNGDGRVDLWESSDQVTRLQTFTNTPDGTLVPGPIDVCSQDSIPHHVLADFNGDGGQDFLVALRCHFTDQSVQVLFGNGQPPVTLASRSTVHFAFDVFPVDVNNDGIPDAGIKDTADDGTITYRLFQNNGHGTFTELTALL
jgi:hypothetical protein